MRRRSRTWWPPASRTGDWGFHLRAHLRKCAAHRQRTTPLSDIDPFRHHPALRAVITPRADSFFRDFRAQKVLDMLAEQGLPADWVHDDLHREADRQATLAGRMDDDLWVFGYGSLMWDPGFAFAEVRRALVNGAARRFCLIETLGGRGTPARPGLVAALDRGPH